MHCHIDISKMASLSVKRSIESLSLTEVSCLMQLHWDLFSAVNKSCDNLTLNDLTRSGLYMYHVCYLLLNINIRRYLLVMLWSNIMLMSCYDLASRRIQYIYR